MKEQEKPVANGTLNSEHERRLRDIYRPDKEKFELLVKMFRRNLMLRNAKIKHKP